MFRKIHSNRDTRDTLWSSLSTEFAVYFSKLKSCCKALLMAYPKQAFAVMVFLMIASLVCTLIIGDPGEPKLPGIVPAPVSRPVENGFSQILSQADALRESLRLKEEITAMLAKDSLTSSDSIRLEKAIDRLHLLTIKTNPQ